MYMYVYMIDVFIYIYATQKKPRSHKNHETLRCSSSEVPEEEQGDGWVTTSAAGERVAIPSGSSPCHP